MSLSYYWGDSIGKKWFLWEKKAGAGKRGRGRKEGFFCRGLKGPGRNSEFALPACVYCIAKRMEGDEDGGKRGGGLSCIERVRVTKV